MFGLLLVLLHVLFSKCDELTTIVSIWHYSLMPCLTYSVYLSSSIYIPVSIMPCIWCHWWPLGCMHHGWVLHLLEWEEKTLHRPHAW